MIRTGLIWTAVMIGTMFVIAFYVKLGLGDAESVPVHWNAAGEADGFASASGAMLVYWILIGTAIFMGGVFAGLPLLGSARDDILKIRKLYLSIWLGSLGILVVLTAVIGWVTYANVVGANSPRTDIVFEGMTRGVLAITSLGLIALGNHLPKTRQNNVIGVRTQKTLSDKENWERTHRYAGKAFFIAGAACLMIACFVPLIVGVFLWGVPIIAASLLSYGYSNRIDGEG